MRSGASLVSVNPVFSPDNKFLFVCSANVIKVFSTVTGECVRDLVGHEDVVTGVVVHPKNKLQILSCSDDKSVIAWDYTDGIKLKSYMTGRLVTGMFTCELNDKLFLLTTKKKETSDFSCMLIEKSLSDKGGKYREILAALPNDRHMIDVAQKGTYFAYVHNLHLNIKSLEPKDSVTHRHSVEGNQRFTCVACHPSNNCVATGSIDGTIFLWFDYLLKTAVKSTLHWHSLPVREIAFTPEGSYLLSGGHECVLVKWHLNTEYRDFLPRLGAPVNFLNTSSDNQLYAIAQDDNMIQVVSSSFSVQQVFQGLTRTKSGTIPTGLRCDPRTQALVLNGKPGHVQFYNVHEDKQLFNLDIVCQNYVSAESLDKPLTYTEITHVEFDEKGRWLSTVEYWNNGVMSAEIRLKFWIFEDENQSYTLNTTAEHAHSDKIGDLKFRPLSNVEGLTSPNMVVTTSVDGKFKIWSLSDDSDIYRENVKWICQSVGFYRDLPAGEAEFSEDGTLLAVVFDGCITLWDPDTNLLRETLVSNVQNAKINHVMFGNHNCSQYLMACSDNTLTVWNLVTCSISWSADFAVVCITKDPLSEYIAAFNSNKQLCVFKPSDPKPSFVQKNVCKNNVKSSVFIPHPHRDLYNNSVLSWQNRSELYFMDSTQQLFSVSLENQKPQAKSKEDLVTIEGNLPQTALSLIMKGHTNKSALRVDQKNLTIKPQDKYLKEILSSPAHVQPSVAMLCQPFLKSLLVPLPNSSSQKDKDDNDSDNNDDDDAKADIEGSQTGSLDSGLESDSDMDTTENQSVELSQSKATSKIKIDTQSKHAENNVKSNITKHPLSVGQKEREGHVEIASVFRKQLSWYTT